MSNNNAHLPPQAGDAERAVLGSILMDVANGGVIDEVVPVIKNSDWFYYPNNKDIFDAIIHLHENSQPIDIITVEQRLDDQGKTSDTLNASTLSGLTMEGNQGNVGYYANIIDEKYRKRELIKIGNSIVEGGYDGDISSEEVLDKSDQLLLNMQQGRNSGDTNIQEAAEQACEQIMSAQESDNGITGVPSGLDIDNITSGFQDGEMTIIAARPSQGKSALLTTISKNLAENPEFEGSVGIISLEMTSISLAWRMLVADSSVDGFHAKTGRLTEADKQKVMDSAGKLHNLKDRILLNDTPALSIREIRSKARLWKRKYNLKLLFIDYIQLAEANGDYRSRNQEVAEISRGTKAIAKDLNIPVVPLAQLSRASEHRADKRPQLSDLRSSGQLEQDSDMVVFIHRPEYYDIMEDANGESTRGVAEILIRKNRNGPTGKKKLLFNKKYMRFENLRREFDNENPPF